ncbi:lysozyme inhibitor LprI family protein [Pseudomonas sp. Irchel 3E20]|uniref:lysozyme inhibitor LprI family protein n=1 Tax=Pseudomonas sp. Irchel 3E20 TaxID=2008983 RepID=UPI000BA3F802|nr:lysozyme inhibitor LprI family protein [Pseudomonas sp. Irchel 3E20]
MNRHRLFAPLLLLGLCATAQANPDADSPAYSQCMKASGGVTVEMLDCQAAEIKRQDTRLNQAYKAAMAALDADKKAPLKDVQRLWLKYRDANCGFVASLTGGTIDAINASSCFLDMTKTRARELENLVGP